MISLSYSKISLEEIASKLQLDSPEDAEFIVAKVSDLLFTIVIVTAAVGSITYLDATRFCKH